MLVLELFAGTRSIGKAFERHGHKVVSIDWDEQFKDCIHLDIGALTAERVIDLCGGVKPDVIWASPDCITFSIAAISHHRTRLEDGTLAPKSEYAKVCDKVDIHMCDLIRELNPKYYFIENPVGGMRKMKWMQWSPRYKITYCKYETDLPVSERRMKPTDIWTNHPDPKFIPPCKNGDPCHARAPRGAKTGTQGRKNHVERSRIPDALCEHIVKICEE